ncbi:MAG: 8-oxo-dGTP diphosphatase [Candidatus Nomurabacteria bacterium]|jgi:8-oxo-dGTP diphosphatase|nr:8-oxo-dGTP diphosphatase [Candidatus Nomurabacteria bacterium]
MSETLTTLCYLRHGDKVMLAEKQRKVGAGKYNGYGGKLEAGEMPELAMLRETREEICVTPTVYKKLAEILFCNPDDERIRMHTFVATEWDGKPTATDEMKKLEWFQIDKIPYDKLMPCDYKWIDYVLGDQACKGVIYYDENWNVDEKRSIIYTVADFKLPGDRLL